MPRDTHGDFDQVVELSNAFFRDQAAATFALPATEIRSVPGEGFKYQGRVRATLRDLWFGDAAEAFDPVRSAWQTVTQTVPFNAVVFGIDIAGSIQVESIQATTPAGQPISFPVPSSVRTLRVHVGVLVLAPLSVENLASRSARDEDFPAARLPCAVVLLPTTTFFYNVKVGMGDPALPYANQPRESVRGSPFVDWAIDTLNSLKRNGIADLGDPEVVVVAKIQQTLHDTVEAQLLAAMQSTCDWRLDVPGRIGLVASTAEMGVSRMDVRATFASIRVFMQTTGTGGQVQPATRSQLRVGAGASNLPDNDAMAITVNGRTLVEQLRAPLASMFGLPPGAFVAGEPCTIASPVPVTLGGSTYTLLFLQAGVDESSNLILWLFLRASQAAATIDIEIELPITFDARRAVRGAQQVILLTQKVGQARYAASADTLPVWHWIVAAIAEGMVADVLRGPFDFAPQILPTPQTVFLEPNFPGDVSLNQAGAPRNLRTWPGMRLIGGGVNVGVVSEPPGLHPGRFRDHDLVIRLRAFPRYPSPLTVSCMTPDAGDPLRRIDGLGGSFAVPAGSTPRPWAMPVDDAIDWVAGGKRLRVADGTTVILGRAPSDCPPANPDGRPLPFLRTTGDTQTSNNLAELPPCARASTTLSDTFAHWRDVLPFGSTGEDIVNDGVDVGPDCVVTGVTLEMIDRDGNVLATHTFGGPDATTGPAGARMTTNPIGTTSLAVRVYWWFDAYSICRYRLRYSLEGPTCP
jgi:hypothetical protein